MSTGDYVSGLDAVLLSLAVHAGLPLEVLSCMINAFPTFYGRIGKALGAYGRGLGTVLDPAYRDFEAFRARTPAG